MLDDWRDRQIARLEQDLASLRREVWDFDTRLDRRLRERDRKREWQDRDRDWERAGRQLDFMLGVLVCLMWATAGAMIAVAVVQAG